MCPPPRKSMGEILWEICLQMARDGYSWISREDSDDWADRVGADA